MDCRPIDRVNLPPKKYVATTSVDQMVFGQMLFDQKTGRQNPVTSLVFFACRSITIEPVVFLFQFGVYINKGSQLSTNLVS
jgi:hypothetical protein